MSKQIQSPKFYLVWRNPPTWDMRNHPTRRHKKYKDALNEAVRLSKLTNHAFFVVAHQATIQKETIIKEVENG